MAKYLVRIGKGVRYEVTANSTKEAKWKGAAKHAKKYYMTYYRGADQVLGMFKVTAKRISD